MLRAEFQRGVTLDEHIRDATRNQELWAAIRRRAVAAPELVARAEALGGRWHLLALSEDWCGDAVNLLPALGALADAAANLEMRILPRDQNLDLMDAHLTAGARSIPVVLVLDEHFRERGWWGPRPRELQEWVRATGRAMPSDERYRHLRTWYARDRGLTTQREIVEIVEAAAREREAA